MIDCIGERSEQLLIFIFADWLGEMLE